MAETANTENPTPEETLDEPVAESSSRESDEDVVDGEVPARRMTVRESVAGGAKDMYRKVFGTPEYPILRRLLPVALICVFVVAIAISFRVGEASQRDKDGTLADHVVVGIIPSAAQVAEVIGVPDLRLNSSSALNTPSTAKVSFNGLSGKCDGAFNVDVRSRASSHAEFQGIPKEGNYAPVVHVDVYSLKSWKAAQSVTAGLSDRLQGCQGDIPQGVNGDGLVTSLSRTNPIYADIAYAPRGKCTNVIGHATSALYVVSVCGDGDGLWAHQAALAITDILNSNILQLQRFA
jgi:hypothetical protein